MMKTERVLGLLFLLGVAIAFAPQETEMVLDAITAPRKKVQHCNPSQLLPQQKIALKREVGLIRRTGRGIGAAVVNFWKWIY